VLEAHQHGDEPAPVEPDTHHELLALAQAGMAPAAIARQQSIGEPQVYRGLAELVSAGELSLEQALALPEAEIAIIQDALLAQPNLAEDTFSYRQVRQFLSDDYPT